MPTVQEIESLKRQVEDANRDLHQTKGRLKQMRTAHGMVNKTVEDMQKQIEELEGEEQRLLRQYETRLKEYKSKYLAGGTARLPGQED